MVSQLQAKNSDVNEREDKKITLQNRFSLTDASKGTKLSVRQTEKINAKEAQ